MRLITEFESVRTKARAPEDLFKEADLQIMVFIKKYFSLYSFEVVELRFRVYF